VATIPKYRQIAEDLRRKIDSGELANGDQLPTEQELEDEYQASRSTVRDAVKSLTSQGLAEAIPGKGTFVRRIEPFVITVTRDPETGLGGAEGTAYEREIRAQGQQPSFSGPTIEIQRASKEIADALGLKKDAPVVIRHQECRTEGKILSLQTSYYSRELVDRGATRLADPEDIEEGTVRYLQQVVPEAEQTGYADQIRVRTSTPNEDLLFGLQRGSGVAVLENKRTAYNASSVPIRFTVTVYPADRVVIRVREGSAPPAGPVKGGT
jgi:GntR family transcriptional regulator